MQRAPPKHHVERDLLPMEHAVELQLGSRGIEFRQGQAVLPEAIEDGVLNSERGEAGMAKLIMNAVEAEAQAARPQQPLAPGKGGGAGIEPIGVQRGKTR
jgi:hypothetical protein